MRRTAVALAAALAVILACIAWYYGLTPLPPTTPPPSTQPPTQPPPTQPAQPTQPQQPQQPPAGQPVEVAEINGLGDLAALVSTVEHEERVEGVNGTLYSRVRIARLGVVDGALRVEVVVEQEWSFEGFGPGNYSDCFVLRLKGNEPFMVEWPELGLNSTDPDIVGNYSVIAYQAWSPYSVEPIGNYSGVKETPLGPVDVYKAEAEGYKGEVWVHRGVGIPVYYCMEGGGYRAEFKVITLET